MKEKVITIPYEEYQKLETIKKTMESNGDLIYIEEVFSTDIPVNVLRYVYTKDEYIKSVLFENEKLKEKIQELEKSNEKVCFRIGWKSLVEIALVLGIIQLAVYDFKNYL